MKISRGGIFLRGNVWWYYISKDGEQQAKSLKTSIESEALRRFAEIRENLVLGMDQQRIDNAGITFADLWEKYKKIAITHKAPETQSRERYFSKRLLRHFGKMPLLSITPERTQEFIAENSDLEASSINRYFHLLSRLFNLAIEWGYLKTKPIKSARPLREQKKEIERISDDQIGKILSNCDEFYQAVIIFLQNTGARLGELHRLRWKDIDRANKQVTLRDFKTNDIRTVPVPDELITRLEGIKGKEEFVFPRNRSRLKHTVIAICKRAEVKASCHTFRHEYISRLLEAGVDPISIMRLTGHKRLATLQRYAHLAPGFMSGVKEILGSVFFRN